MNAGPSKRGGEGGGVRDRNKLELRRWTVLSTHHRLCRQASRPKAWHTMVRKGWRGAPTMIILHPYDRSCFESGEIFLHRELEPETRAAPGTFRHDHQVPRQRHPTTATCRFSKYPCPHAGVITRRTAALLRFQLVPGDASLLYHHQRIVVTYTAHHTHIHTLSLQTTMASNGNGQHAGANGDSNSQRATFNVKVSKAGREREREGAIERGFHAQARLRVPPSFKRRRARWDRC